MAGLIERYIDRLPFELSDRAHLDRGLRFMLDKISKRPLVRNRTLPMKAVRR